MDDTTKLILVVILGGTAILSWYYWKTWNTTPEILSDRDFVYKYLYEKYGNTWVDSIVKDWQKEHANIPITQQELEYVVKSMKDACISLDKRYPHVKDVNESLENLRKFTDSYWEAMKQLAEEVAKNHQDNVIPVKAAEVVNKTMETTSSLDKVWFFDVYTKFTEFFMDATNSSFVLLLLVIVLLGSVAIKLYSYTKKPWT